jgi:uncharacterized protein (DUF2147 family)
MKAVASISLAFAAAATAQPPAAAPVEGYWKNPIGSAIIAIAPCGDSLCGKVVWASARGQREVAKNTSNVVGTTVLTGLRFARNRWTGTLYIPDDNIHVSAKLELISNRQLKLTGCAVMGLFCRSQIWTRADGPLPSAD